MKQYRKIPSLKFFYEITSDGEVRNVKSKHILVPYIDKYGYKKFSFESNRFEKNHVFVHQLVMECWGPKKPDWATSIDHIDRNRQNNDISNLRWATPVIQAENRDNSYCSAIGKKYIHLGWECQEKPLLLIEENKVFPNSVEASEYVLKQKNLNSKLITIGNHIRACAHGKRKVAYGYTWKFC